MSFLYPSFLWLILPLILFLIKSSKSIIVVIHLIILMLLIISLSRPVKQEVLEKVNIPARDIIIALDVSYSMQASDILPTRYDFAKETIKLLLKQNSTDNIMLIAFTTNPLILSPPTTDHKLIALALETLNPEYILTKGTSLKRLFKKLTTLPQRKKNLILITDGGEEDNLDTLTSLLKNSTISLITLALGTKKGAVIKNKNGTLVKDKEGNLIISRINPLLKTLTSFVHGHFMTASSTPLTTANTLNKLLQENKTLKQDIQKERYHYVELYQIPLFFALFLFLVLHTHAVKYLILLSSLLGFNAQASIFDNYHLLRAYQAYEINDFNTSITHLKQIEKTSLQSKIALANTLYKTKSYQKAIQTYMAIKSTSVSIKQQLYFNIANSYASLKSYNKAKVYYTKVLQLGFDNDAKYNLDIVILLSKKKRNFLGLTFPKSQNANSNINKTSKKKEKRKEENQSSSGTGNQGKNKEKEKKKRKKTLNSKAPQPHPLSSKVYELINKGYIHETQPW